MLVKYSS